MTVKTGQAWAGTFVTLDATGAKAASADAAGTLYVDGTANGATVTVSGSNPYKWSVTLPSLTAGQRCDMYITGTIGTIATAGIVASEQADTSLTSEVKTETAAILADTGTDGVVLKAAGLAADAVTEIQSGLALEATLTAIKGTGWSTETLAELYNLLSTGFTGSSVEDTVNAALAPIFGTGWTDETLVAIDALLDAIKAKSDLIPASPAEAGEYTAAIAAVKSVADDILVDTGTTLDTLVKDIPTNAELATALGTADDAVLEAVAEAKSVIDDLHDTDIPAIKAETVSILEDTGTTLDTLIKDIPTNAELTTALGTADDAVLAAVAAAKVVIDDIHDIDLPAIKAETALIVEDTGTTLPAVLEAIDNFIDTEVAAILEDTGTTLPATLATIAGYTDGIAGDVWSHAHRTLTNQGIDATSPAAGDPLIIYRDSTVAISLTGLADSTNSTKMWFTVKENLEDADTSSILQILFTNAETHTDTLLYVNKAAPISADNGGFVVADHTDGTASITLAAAEAANLPIYAATPLYWDVKMLTAAGVTILSTGTMYIYGTPTRTIS